jgi:hypothetical protein
MIKAFRTMEEYVRFLTGLPILDGEVFCINYLPSALFPKHTIQTFFERVDVNAQAASLSSSLWSYGKRIMRAVEKGTIGFYVDAKAVNNLCLRGLVHESSPKFEVGFAVRAQVLLNLKRMSEAGHLTLIHGPIPYVFRLHPPSGVLLDVAENVNEQRIQGLWLDDSDTYKAFTDEVARLEKSCPLAGRGPVLQDELETAIEHLKMGEPYRGSWG